MHWPGQSVRNTEEQISGRSEHGGIQIIAMPMKAEHYERLLAKRRDRANFDLRPTAQYSMEPERKASMGLSAGGLMRQEIFEDPYNLDAWDQRSASRCFVTIANSKQWMSVTDETPPAIPPSAADYSRHGFPWFEYFDVDAKIIAAGQNFKNIKSVSEMGKELGSNPLPENETVAGLSPLTPAQGRMMG